MIGEEYAARKLVKHLRKQWKQVDRYFHHAAALGLVLELIHVDEQAKLAVAACAWAMQHGMPTKEEVEKDLRKRRLL